MDLRNLIKNKRLYFDGGYGTIFQKKGLPAGTLGEVWNIENPEVIKNIHKDYLNAGADIIKANTFNGNILKFGKNSVYSLEEIIKSGIENAKNAIKESGFENKFVALDIGPTGKLLKPLGDLDFEDAVSIFKETVILGVKYGADLILIETFNDCYETKAAVLAAKENSSLPVFVTNAYDQSGKLMTGASPSAMVALLEGLGVDALGVNCSLGPEKMIPIIEEYVKYSSLPIIVNPNAGLPVFKNGETVFNVSATDFAEDMKILAEKGASLLGGCCGTGPDYILKTKYLTQDMEYKVPDTKDFTVISSYTDSVIFDEIPVLIGERINPTGKPLLKSALKENNIQYILNEGLMQEEKGAFVLDVNTGLPEIDEKKVLPSVVSSLQSVTTLPLQIDTSDISAMENALRIYNGKALINSVSGKQEVMDKIFPVAKKYGGVIVALTLDDEGIPDTAEKRIEIALKIIKEGEKYGFSKKDFLVDPLAMTISSDTNSANVTLDCIEKLNSLGIKTSLGVSNVSFGLPERQIVNSAFFTLAMEKGLKGAIMNPHSKEMTDAYYSFLALKGLDKNFEKFISYATKTVSCEIKEEKIENPGEKLIYAIKKGLKGDAENSAKELIKTADPLDIVNNYIIPALDFVGKGFENKTVFLPQLLMSADSAKQAFDVIKQNMVLNGSAQEKKFTVVIATVKGDIHDIGKNIVKVLFENYGYNVIDLGKDVSPEEIFSATEKYNAKVVALSALMTTTVPAMKDSVKLIKTNLPAVKVIVGGAVLTKDYANEMNADFYAIDAMAGVRYLETLN